MLRDEAFRLVSQPEQSHERFHPRDFTAASTDAGGYAAAQARTPDPSLIRAAVRKLAGYLRRPPDTATVEDLRNFQLHLVDHGTSPITLNATITGLKFFFDVTLDRAS